MIIVLVSVFGVVVLTAAAYFLLTLWASKQPAVQSDHYEKKLPKCRWNRNTRTKEVLRFFLCCLPRQQRADRAVQGVISVKAGKQRKYISACDHGERNGC